MRALRSTVVACAALSALAGACGSGSSVAPQVVVTIAPKTSAIAAGATQQFAAAVSGTTDGNVVWSVQEPGGGAVSATGLYTAPASAGVFHVVATSTADPTKSDAATVTVSTAQPAVAIAISPHQAAVQAGATQQFTATVTGASNTAVTWRIEEAGGGTIDAGLYTAPQAEGTYHVVATSDADPTKSDTATVTVTLEPPPVTVSISPRQATVQVGATQQFQATVTGTADTAVTWSVQEAAGGTVNAGLYTAPQAAGTYHVIATSAADSTKSDTATVTVTAQPPIAVSISPRVAVLQLGGTQQFSATVTGTSNTAVTWSVQEANGGAVDAGLYTAPQAAGSYHVVATSVADSTKSDTATVTVTDASQDLCAGLVQDKVAHPMTAVAKPAVGQTYRDPQFNTTVRRISDAAAAGAGDVIPVYSTIQAWNADESYLLLYHVGNGSHHLYDGKTYAHLKALNIDPADLEQVYWDTSDPKVLYYANRTTRILYAFNVDTGTATAVHDFKTAPSSCTADLTGGVDPMWTSWDSRFFGFVCGTKHFSYDKQTNTVGTVATITSGGNQPCPGPSGALYYLNRNDAAGEIRDVNMNLLRTISDFESAEHASIGSSDGKDTQFSIQFDSTPNGTVVAVDMATGAKRAIVGPSTGYPYPPGGTHLSAVAYKNPGWLAVSVVGDTSGAGVLDQEVLLINANTGGKVCRVAHHRSHASDYWAEPHVTISPTGTRLLYGSDWGGGAVVDSYVVELPAYTP